MLSVDLKQIGALYESVLIKESPDNITVDGKYYEYDNKDLGNYTGIMNGEGKFIMSKDIIGHYSFLDELRDIVRGDAPFENLITNFDNVDELRSSGIVQHPVKFRIWPKFKVFNTWDKYKPYFKDAVDSAINAAGSDPKEYRFDPNDGGGNEENFKTYDEYVKVELTDEEKEAVEEAERQKQRDAEALGRYMAGGAKKPIDYSMEPKQRPTFYSRSGD